MAAPTAKPRRRGTRARPRRPGRQRVYLVLGSTFGVLALLGAGVVAFASLRLNDIERHQLALSDVEAGDPQNYLVVGSDSRAEIDETDPDSSAFVGQETAGEDSPDTVGQRADTIMVVRVEPATGTLHLLSLQR